MTNANTHVSVVDSGKSDILDETLLKEKRKIEAQEISNKNNKTLDELENIFKEFGFYTRKYWADRGTGHQGLSGHTGRLHVFIGGNKENAKYLVFSFDQETGTKEQVWYGANDFIEGSFSKNKPLFTNRKDGKGFALSQAVKNGCTNIIEPNGMMKEEEWRKRHDINN